MKKCISSFLICFVFAFGLITAFGCRDNVLAYSSNLNLDSYDIFASTYRESHSSDYVGEYLNHSLVSFSGLNNEGDKIFFFYTKMFNPYASTSDYSTYQYDLYAITIGANDYCSCSCSLRYGQQTVFESTIGDWIYSQNSLAFSNVGRSDLGYYVSRSSFVYSINTDGDFSTSLPVFDIGDRASLDFIQSLSAQELMDMYIGKLPDGVVDINKSYDFSEDIGYLTGFSHELTQYIESESSNSDKGQVWDTYSWNLTTSSGYTIQSDDTVRLRLVCSYGDFARDIVEYDVSGDKSVYMVDRSDLLEKCDSIAAYKDSLSFWEILKSGFGKSDPLSVVCYACVFTSDGRCGSWIRQDSTWNMDNGGNGYDPNVSVGNFDDDGNFVSDSDKGYVGGQGNSTYDPDSGILYSGVDNLDSSSLIGAIRNLVDGVGQVPQIIALMFVWLPSWVLAFFSVCVAIWGLVLVKKAIFG